MDRVLLTGERVTADADSSMAGKTRRARGDDLVPDHHQVLDAPSPLPQLPTIRTITNLRRHCPSAQSSRVRTKHTSAMGGVNYMGGKRCATRSLYPHVSLTRSAQKRCTLSCQRHDLPHSEGLLPQTEARIAHQSSVWTRLSREQGSRADQSFACRTSTRLSRRGAHHLTARQADE